MATPRKIRSAVTRKELQNAYGVTSKTLTKWLKRADIDLGRMRIIPPATMNQILACLGIPPGWED